jgi:hypothetical protein
MKLTWIIYGGFFIFLILARDPMLILSGTIGFLFGLALGLSSKLGRLERNEKSG